MTPRDADIEHNISAVRRRLSAAAHRAHRDSASIRLVAVSKTFPSASVRAAAANQQLVFGENRVQELAVKAADLGDLPIEWHLIGHLQSNKAKKAVALAKVIQSIDSLDLLNKVDQAAAQIGVRPDVLLQVDLAHEATKSGVVREDLPRLVEAAIEARSVRMVGLMTIPPVPEHPEDSRPWFRQLRELRDDLIAQGLPAAALQELSMGMSGDFDVAIEEGATIVRVGTAIFGSRVETLEQT